MDLITKLNLDSTAEIAIIVIIVYGLTQAIKQTQINNKWLPWISMLLGIFSGLISVFITNDHNFSGACFLGFLTVSQDFLKKHPKKLNKFSN